MIKVIRKIDIKFLFQSHCNCNLNSMLLRYNSIAIKEQKQWDCEGEECLGGRVRLWGDRRKWGKEINGDVKLERQRVVR